MDDKLEGPPKPKNVVSLNTRKLGPVEIFSQGKRGETSNPRVVQPIQGMEPGATPKVTSLDSRREQRQRELEARRPGHPSLEVARALVAMPNLGTNQLTEEQAGEYALELYSEYSDEERRIDEYIDAAEPEDPEELSDGFVLTREQARKEMSRELEYRTLLIKTLVDGQEVEPILRGWLTDVSNNPNGHEGIWKWILAVQYREYLKKVGKLPAGK